ncbi:rod-determining factor RdfA [Haloarcula litorea]|uniref:rod-determining factor RdfA n=1 Tax=Haloarcula litorea TaxID=3032579 RepID=UPI0023E83749|nr:rod-determining factor RdfA [Halomicroarcula sp. GDY20]
MSQGESDRRSNKVARLIDEYELEGLGTELEARWTDDGEDRMSLRDLAEYFNKRLLETELIEAGMSALDSEVDTTYRQLTDDDVSTGVRTETRSRLEQNGIDVDALESNFVTYQAIRSYLQNVRGASYEGPSDAEKVETDQQSIQRLLTRTHTVIDQRVEALRDTDRLALDDFEVFVDAQVLCQACGTQHSITDLLEQGGCECQQS